MTLRDQAASEQTPPKLDAELNLRVQIERRQDDPSAHQMPFCKAAPAVQAAWSPSYLDMLQQCPRRYYYEKIERWTPRKTSPPLWFGILYHAGVEVYLRARVGGADHEAAIHEAGNYILDASWPLPDFSYHDSARGRYQLLTAVLWYLDERPRAFLEPVLLRSGQPAVELDFEIEIPLVNPDGDYYRLRSHLDDLCVGPQYAGAIIEDRKTTKSSVNENYLADFKPANQTLLYVLAGAVILEEAELKIIMEICQLLVSGVRFHTHVVEYTKAQLIEWLQNTIWWIRQAERYAEDNYWPMNLASCDKKGGCPFRKVCQKDPSSREFYLRSEWEKLPSVFEIAGFARLLSWLC